MYYYHLDGLGSVVALSDVNNVLVERYAYDVFGRPTIRDANGTEIAESAFDNPYLFTARAYDTESGLYYYRARYYDYYTARFLQPDPLGYADGLSLYGYVGNNPCGYSDPWGLCKNQSRLERLMCSISGYGTGMGEGIERFCVGVPYSILHAAAQYVLGPLYTAYTVACLPETLKQTYATGLQFLKDISNPADAERFSRAIGNAVGFILATGLTIEAGSGIAGASGKANVAYRYVNAEEARIAGRTGRVANTTGAGDPKLVFYGTDEFTSASQAEKALRIGKLDPRGPNPTPTHRITVDTSGAGWGYAGNVEGGSGIEMGTSQQLPVRRIDPLDP